MQLNSEHMRYLGINTDDENDVDMRSASTRTSMNFSLESTTARGADVDSVHQSSGHGRPIADKKTERFQNLLDSLSTNNTDMTKLTLNGNTIDDDGSMIEMLAEAIRNNSTVSSVKIDGRFLEHLSIENQERIFHAVGGLPTLKSLDIVGVQDDWIRLPLPVLTRALSQATGLEALTLEDYRLTGDDEVQQESFIKALRGLKSLTNFRLVDLVPERPSDLDSVVKALSSLKSLEEIHINYDTRLQTSDAFPQAVTAESVGRLSKDTIFFKMLKKLVLTNIQIGHEHMKIFADGLHKNSTLEFVDLSYNILDNAAGEAIASALQKNKTLETLRLEGVQLDRVTSSKIAAALKRNKSLKVLSLRNNDMDEDEIISIVEALKTNSTLKQVYISDNCGHMGSNSVNGALLEMMKTNYALQRLEMDFSYDMHLKIQFYLKLNKAGRQRLLRCDSDNSASHTRDWVETLIQTQHDLSCTYYFVREYCGTMAKLV